jgi:16S rRNA U1498 N3-methylase RsmE
LVGPEGGPANQQQLFFTSLQMTRILLVGPEGGPANQQQLFFTSLQMTRI